MSVRTTSVLFAIALFASAAGAQQRPSETRPRDPGAFVLEAGAGALGSLAGIGLTALVSDCGVEDLA